MAQRENKLTEKDMSVLHEMDQTAAQRDQKIGTLKDYSMKHRVSVRWDLNDEAVRDQMFELKIDDYTVILDAEELLRYLRWV